MLTPHIAALPAHARQQDLRKQRKAEEQQQKAADAKQWREKSLQEGRQKVGKAAAAQQQQKEGGHKRKGGEQQAAAAGAAAGPGGSGGDGGQQQQGGKQQKRQRGGSEGGLSFNKLDFGSGAVSAPCSSSRAGLRSALLLALPADLPCACRHASAPPLLNCLCLPRRRRCCPFAPSFLPADPRQQKRQRKQTKEQLLAAAQERAAAATELGASQEGKAQLQREAWGTALQRAKGDKVLDDPRLLKRSMKKVGRLAGRLAGWQDGWGAWRCSEASCHRDTGASQF